MFMLVLTPCGVGLHLVGLLITVLVLTSMYCQFITILYYLNTMVSYQGYVVYTFHAGKLYTGVLSTFVQVPC